MDNITVGGVTLHSPLLNAAGTMGFGSSYADYIDLHRLGGLVTRTMTVKPRRGADSADSSVLNRSGHKDEFLLRALAERLSAVAGCAVAAVGGVHYDGLDQQGLRSAAHIEQQALAQAEDWAAELLP